MEQGLDCIEYDEWKEFYRLEPWGCAVEDGRAAQGINYLIAVNSAKEHTWIPTHELFPRNPRHWEKAKRRKAEEVEQELAFNLHAALSAHNERLEAKEQSEPPIP